MTAWAKAVYALVAAIPAGRAATYGQLAALTGRPRAGRIVGQLMVRAPDGLPCHRVLYRDGSLCRGDAFGSQVLQRRLLEAEGIPFLPDGRVDLKRCLFSPDHSLQHVRKEL